MLLLIKLAWRNSLRNKRRTFLAGLAIGIGLAALIYSDAMIIGMGESMVKTATDTFLGQGQIHLKGFRNTFEAEKVISHSHEILETLKHEREIKNFAPRTMVSGMLTSPANITAVVLVGIESVLEAPISKIDEAIIKGTYLVPGDNNKILVGSKLAERMEIDIGDRVVVTVAQAETGDLSQEMFRVGGIFHLNMNEIDDAMTFISLEKAQALLALEKNIHEIVFNFKDVDSSHDLSPEFIKQYSRDGNEALSWKEILPELESALYWSQYTIAIIALILFTIIALGIMNTLFMSLYERMFEFGILRAVGTRPLRMALMIVCEAGMLAIISILLGDIIGLLLVKYSAVHGINYVGIEFGGVTFSEPIYPVLKIHQFIKYPVYLFFFTLLVSLYPAIFAARMSPTRAMKRSY